MTSLDKLRQQTIVPIAYGQLIHAPLILMMGFLIGSAQTNVATALSLAAAIIGVVAVKMAKTSASSRNLVATGYVLQACILVFLFQGHPWQIDMHMYFYASLAIVAGMFDWRTILLGAAVVAVHHLALNFIVPLWIFPGGTNLIRVVLHAAVLVLETAVLVWLSIKLQQALARSDTDSEEASEGARIAKSAQGLAKEAERQAHLSKEQALVEAENAKRATEDSIIAMENAQSEAERAHVAEEEMKVAAQKSEEHTRELGHVVADLSGGLGALANGDLTIRLKNPYSAEYEVLRNDFNKTTEMLAQLISAIQNKSNFIQSNIHSLTTASDNLSTRTENQTQAIDNISDNLNLITENVYETDKSVQLAGVDIRSAGVKVKSVNQLMNQATTAMQEIQSSSDEITNIISVIDEIAFQTNLLALNAGVEAARAGEEGRGFAVVAREVRDLAQRSAGAAKEIKSLITKSTSQVSRGAALVENTSEAITEIVEQIGNFNKFFEEVSSASKKQSSALTEISETVQTVGRLTQTNAAMVEESTATTHDINNETHSLNLLLRKFKSAPNTNQKRYVA